MRSKRMYHHNAQTRPTEGAMLFAFSRWARSVSAYEAASCQLSMGSVNLVAEAKVDLDLNRSMGCNATMPVNFGTSKLQVTWILKPINAYFLANFLLECYVHALTDSSKHLVWPVTPHDHCRVHDFHDHHSLCARKSSATVCIPYTADAV